MSEKRILKMVPPNDPRLLSKIAPYQDDMLKENNFIIVGCILNIIFHIFGKKKSKLYRLNFYERNKAIKKL